MADSESFDFANINSTLVSMDHNFSSLSMNIDDFFLLIMAIIIFLMQAGFAFLEAGSVRSKNATNILLKNMVESCIGGLSYWIVGWAFAFGTPSNPFIGYGHFATPPKAKYSLWFFQFVFAATTSTIVSGAVAERCDFGAFIVYSLSLTGFIYPVVTHWTWAEGGWLGTLGYKDFAGSGVVHCVGGVFAFVGAFLLGPRIGRFEGKTTNKIPGHSVALVSLGAFILMFGFFAFNGGSQASITAPGDGIVVARAMFNTIVSGACGGLVAMLITYCISRKWSILVTVNGVLAGMVAICAGCDAVYHWGAAAIGTCAGVVYIIVSTIVIMIRVDDPLDAVAVHFGGGTVGVLLEPLFDFNQGVFLTGFTRQSGLFVAYNVIGWLSIVAWTAVSGFIVFGLLKLFGKFRVASEVEIKGLDIFKHAEPAYPAAAYADQIFKDCEHDCNVESHGPLHPELEALHNIQTKKAASQAEGNGVLTQRRVANTEPKLMSQAPCQALVVRPIAEPYTVQEPMYEGPLLCGFRDGGYYNPVMNGQPGQSGYGYGGGAAHPSYFVSY